MDNEEDYMELYKLLAKLKFNLVKQSTHCFGNKDMVQHLEEEISKIDKFFMWYSNIDKRRIICTNQKEKKQAKG